MANRKSRKAKKASAGRGQSPLPERPKFRAAPIGLRLIAFILDLLVVTLPTNVIWFQAYGNDAPGAATSGSVPWLATLVLPVYEIGLVAFFGATLGKLVVGLRVVEYLTEKNTTLRQNVTRFCVKWVIPLQVLSFMLPGTAGEITGMLSALAAVAVFVSAFSNPLRRGFHDRLAQTMVRRKQLPV